MAYLLSVWIRACGIYRKNPFHGETDFERLLCCSHCKLATFLDELPLHELGFKITDKTLEKMFNEKQAKIEEKFRTAFS